MAIKKQPSVSVYATNRYEQDGTLIGSLAPNRPSVHILQVGRSQEMGTENAFLTKGLCHGVLTSL